MPNSSKSVTKKNKGGNPNWVKGVSGNKPIFPRRASTNNIMKTPLFTVGVDSSKDIILQRMKIEKVGNGYVHFP